MTTAARVSFEENWKTIADLESLRQSGGGPISHQQRAALNKAELVFCITAWEAYVEDAVREAASFLATNCKDYGSLPLGVRTALQIAVTPPSGLGSTSPSGRGVDALVDQNWRKLLEDLSLEATQGASFNTPRSEQVRKLFKKWCGVDVTTAWTWQGFKAPSAASRLDESIGLRGEIVHTGKKPDGLNKQWIETYGEKNITKLVEKTEGRLVKDINGICGLQPGAPGSFGA